ncbi:MAG: GatB/YqeY domain-containing protein [Alphaproteobacteria bacterium]|jgi:uncharacterized protein YqeY|nr:GatB/YqeY domain-containing protein [Alphaproteobacteria bacterium]
MSIKATIKKQMLLSKDKDTKQAYRNLYAIMDRIEIDTRKELSDEEIIKIFDKQVKKQKETYEVYVKNDRPDLATKEKIEIEIMEEYIPEKMSEEDVLAEINKVISSTENCEMKDIMKHFKINNINADMKMVSILANKTLKG